MIPDQHYPINSKEQQQSVCFSGSKIFPCACILYICYGWFWKYWYI